jgi:hypothetical protein
MSGYPLGNLYEYFLKNRSNISIILMVFLQLVFSSAGVSGAGVSGAGDSGAAFSAGASAFSGTQNRSQLRQK